MKLGIAKVYNLFVNRMFIFLIGHSRSFFLYFYICIIIVEMIDVSDCKKPSSKLNKELHILYLHWMDRFRTVDLWCWDERDGVTRFGEISPLWQKIKVFGNFWRVYLAFWKNFNQLWPIFNALGQMFVVVNGQLLSK